jgi:hypothetical protein
MYGFLSTDAAKASSLRSLEIYFRSGATKIALRTSFLARLIWYGLIPVSMEKARSQTAMVEVVEDAVIGPDPVPGFPCASS